MLMVTRLDRLARSTLDLLRTLAEVNEREAEFKSLADEWANTTSPQGRLMLTVIGGLAEFERDLIKARTSEGRAHAVARGVKMGPKHKLTPEQRRQARAWIDDGKPKSWIASTLNVSPSTITRLPAP